MRHEPDLMNAIYESNTPIQSSAFVLGSGFGAVVHTRRDANVAKKTDGACPHVRLAEVWDRLNRPKIETERLNLPPVGNSRRREHSFAN